MKKGVVVAIVLILLLCVIVAGGGAAVWYFLLRNTPEKAFDAAMEALNNGDYYQYKNSSEVTMEISVPDYPEYSMDMEMKVSGEGKVDIQNDKFYMKTSTTSDGSTEIQEIYFIGDDVYSRYGSENFEKASEEEAEELRNKSFEIYEKMVGAVYTLLSDEEIDDTNCYHYKVPLDEAILEDYTKSFTGATSGAGVTVNDLTLEDAYMEVWVSKSSSKVIKTVMKIETFNVDVTSSGVGMSMSMDGLEVTTTFSDWGEEVEIEAPI